MSATQPSDAEIIAEAWNAIEILREACPLPWRVNEIRVVDKIRTGLAALNAIPDADGGPAADITISRAKLGKNWRRAVQTRVGHEWMELALAPLRIQAQVIYCPAASQTIENICERAAEVMESMMSLVLSLKSAK